VTSTSDPFAAVGDLPGVREAVAEARGAVDLLLGHRVLRRRSADVAAESALRGARASAALEGADWPLEEIRRRTSFGNDPDGWTVQGALRVSAELGSLVETWRRAPLQVLARLHVVAAADVVAEDRLGRPRGGTDDVVDPFHLDPPPPGDEVTARLDGLARLLVGETSAPAIVVAAIVHGELLALRPFVWGNGLVARAAERLVLVSRAVDPKAVSSPEVGHAEGGGPAYRDAVRQYLAGTPDGVAAWVVHCAQAVALGAREGIAVCEALQRG
jgi:Fic family protein